MKPSFSQNSKACQRLTAAGAASAWPDSLALQDMSGNLRPSWQAEAELWDHEDEVGYVSTLLDPSNQSRESITANRRLGDLLGLHREELLSRLASHDFELPFAQVRLGFRV